MKSILTAVVAVSIVALSIVAVSVLVPGLAFGQQLIDDAKPGDTVAWETDLKAAFAKAKTDSRILLVCVNAKHVAGEKVEPAAKGLRDIVYKDPRVVTKSREFVCAFLGTSGSSGDYGELRALGIDGTIVSPQHIFIRPDGTAILHRVEYWRHGAGEKAVAALLRLMDTAQQKLAAANVPAGDPLANAPNEAVEARLTWIEEMLALVREGNAEKRKQALQQMVAADKDGDCIDRLVTMIPESKKETAILVDLIRALGRDGLLAAAPAISDQLKHKEEVVRGNAAVSLEYIGSKDKKVVSAIRKAAEKENVAPIKNHMFRALGRCGVDDKKIGALLLKRADSGKSEYATYGPLIGLAYFEKQKKVARGVEKMLKKIGIPGSRRGGGTNVVKRGLASWTLSEIADPKSGPFVREELMARLENVKAFWVGPLRGFWDGVARKCEGDERIGDQILTGVRGFAQFAREGELDRYGAETRGLMDEYRTEREGAGFRPKGDTILDTGE